MNANTTRLFRYSQKAGRLWTAGAGQIGSVSKIEPLLALWKRAKGVGWLLCITLGLLWKEKGQKNEEWWWLILCVNVAIPWFPAIWLNTPRILLWRYFFNEIVNTADLKWNRGLSIMWVGITPSAEEKKTEVLLEGRDFVARLLFNSSHSTSSPLLHFAFRPITTYISEGR